MPVQREGIFLAIVDYKGLHAIFACGNLCADRERNIDSLHTLVVDMHVEIRLRLHRRVVNVDQTYRDFGNIIVAGKVLHRECSAAVAAHI